MPLFNRRAVLLAASLNLSDFRIQFDVSKDLRGRPNKAKITVYNLSADSRRRLSAAERKRVVLLAGYVTETPYAVFVGILDRVEHKQEGADWTTTVSGSDGVPRSVRVRGSFGKGSRVSQVLGEIANQMSGAGIGAGNLRSASTVFGNRTVGSGGLSFSGPTDVTLDGILESLGLEWSVQDQQLQILERGKPRQVRATVLSPDSGLVGTPEVLERGRVRTKSLLTPGLDPGLLVNLQSRDLSGFFRVDSARYQGDTHAQPWYVQCELRPRV